MKTTNCTDCDIQIQQKPTGRPRIRCEACNRQHRRKYLADAKRKARAAEPRIATMAQQYPETWAYMNPTRSQ